MTRHLARSLVRAAAALTLLGAVTAASPTSAAEPLTVGVFVPQAAFETNAARSAWADSVARALTTGTADGVAFHARLFARRDDALAFLRAGGLDLLIVDGLVAADVGGDVIAHAKAQHAQALYAKPGTTVLGLKGAVVAIGDAGGAAARVAAHAALEDELDATRFFGTIRRTKDAAAALGAVEVGAAAAAFAPLGHPAASGLTVLARGGATVPAVVVVPPRSRLAADPTARAAVVRVITGTVVRGGGLSGFAAGPGKALGALQRAANTRSKVATTPVRLTEAAGGTLRPPPIRLQAEGSLRQPVQAPAAAVPATLPPEREFD